MQSFLQYRKQIKSNNLLTQEPILLTMIEWNQETESFSHVETSFDGRYHREGNLVKLTIKNKLEWKFEAHTTGKAIDYSIQND